MKPWQKPPGKIKRKGTLLYHVAKYQQARAEAAMERLRLAVDVLKIATDGRTPEMWCYTNFVEALKKIGELPKD